MKQITCINDLGHMTLKERFAISTNTSGKDVIGVVVKDDKGVIVRVPPYSTVIMTFAGKNRFDSITDLLLCTQRDKSAEEIAVFKFDSNKELIKYLGDKGCNLPVDRVQEL